MTKNQFHTLLERRLERTRSVLDRKSNEYAKASDRLYNFKEAGKLREENPGQSLLGMLVKHWVSIQDMVRDLESGKVVPREIVDEKIGDAINYLILLEAIFTEARDQANG